MLRTAVFVRGLRQTLLALVAGAIPTIVAPADAGPVDKPTNPTAIFTDGRSAPTRSVFTYIQPDRVRAFNDKAPNGQRYQVMAFACYACDPNSHINWRATTLHTQEYNTEIAAASAVHGIEQALIRAVMHAESGFNPNARSPTGAVGLMQLMPDTARALGVGNITSVADNIRGGTRYLAQLLAQYGGDLG